MLLLWMPPAMHRLPRDPNIKFSMLLSTLIIFSQNLVCIFFISVYVPFGSLFFLNVTFNIHVFLEIVLFF